VIGGIQATGPRIEAQKAIMLYGSRVSGAVNETSMVTHSHTGSYCEDTVGSAATDPFSCLGGSHVE
jgi:hypothetical protein